MRVLLEQECTAIAGGHESDCEKKIKTVFIAGGAVAGGLAGAGAFSVPGAIVGASAGGLAADAFGHMICSMETDEDDEEESEIDPELAQAFEQQLVAWLQSFAFPNSYGPKRTGPHELVVDTS